MATPPMVHPISRREHQVREDGYVKCCFAWAPATGRPEAADVSGTSPGVILGTPRTCRRTGRGEGGGELERCVFAGRRLSSSPRHPPIETRSRSEGYSHDLARRRRP